MRRLLKHPNGMGFRPTGGIEWPNDRFTKRRLRDGTVKVEEEKKEETHPPPLAHGTGSRRSR